MSSGMTGCLHLLRKTGNGEERGVSSGRGWAEERPTHWGDLSIFRW